MSDPANYIGNYGVALTPAELADLHARLLVEAEIPAVRAYAENQPTFAGMWIDQRAGGVIKVAFAGDAAAHLAQIQAAPQGRVSKPLT